MKIIAFGNSITAERATIESVFAQRLPHLLSEIGISAKVINEGIPGSHSGSIQDNDLFKIKHGMDRFQEVVLNQHPDLVTIGFGTNDAYIDAKEKGGESRIALKDYRQNLTYMIESLLAQHVKIVLIAPNILGSNYPDFQNERMFQYVKVVRRLAKTYKLGLQDNYQLFLDYERNTGQDFDGLMLDGCHPNDTGHELIAENLTKEIKRILL
ncbi:SGNH/GDSL hydrolase family protein [Membranihabitans marinus]|uniref:SGNH/GDSL hydrolase family protein n=1 Tax=Membranihabitans marinus TaxID=1227546 RepID=UPI001F3A2A8C|nr:SGNH/GDSL hydrolase family protein [Membranihabitans marinus]